MQATCRRFICLVLVIALVLSLSAVSAMAKNPEYKWKFAQTTVRPTQAISMKLFRSEEHTSELQSHC